MSSNFLTMLGFAQKAGKLTAGFCAVVRSIKKKDSKLVIIANDISKKSEKEIKFTADDTVLVIRTEFSIEELSAATGKKAGIFSVNDERFAAAFLNQTITGGNANYDKD